MKKWLLLALYLIGIIPAQAWLEKGHMIVADIAYQQLTPEVRKRADALIAAENDQYNFITAAKWADDLKEQNVHTYTPWHYVTLKFRNIEDPLPTREDFPPDNHVAWAIEHEKAILKDPQTSEKEKGLALRRLIHWVGDIHQPLHATSHVSIRYLKGDRGGNDFRVRDEGAQNLHHLWDDGMQQWRGKSVSVLSAEMLKNAPQDLGSMDPYTWAIDHHVIGRKYAYQNIQYRGIPSEAYMKQGARICREQVTLAGLRLGAILNEVLNTTLGKP